MPKNTVGKRTFIGKIFMPNMMDEQKAFTSSNIEMENDEEFKNFLKDNQLEDKRSIMFVFGPENFMYWYGVIVDGDTEVEVPSSFMKYDLPEGKVVEEKEKGALASFNVPASFLVQPFFEKVISEKIPVYENPGDSPKPYLVEDLNLNKGEITSTWYLDE